MKSPLRHSSPNSKLAPAMALLLGISSAACEPSSVTAGSGSGDARSDPTLVDGGISDVDLDATNDNDAANGNDAGPGRDSGSSGSPPACTAPATVTDPLTTSVNPSLYGTYDPGPLLPVDERAHVFLEGSGMWMTVAHGSAVTELQPAPLEGGSNFAAWRSLTGWSAITFARSSEVIATAFDGSRFTEPVVTPCAGTGSQCQARAGEDGHLWIYAADGFFEQTGDGFVTRGGGPTAPWLWDVDARGALTVVGTGEWQAQELLAVWRLEPDAAGWTQVGALLEADVAEVDATIEGGFGFGSDGHGALAPDGSIHLFSNARCIGTGERNRAQVYLRSRDGASWSVEPLPHADELIGQLTWRNVSFWAADYDRVRYVVISSTEPVYNGWDWTYPDRRYDVIARCLDDVGVATFARVASATHPGWSVRGFSDFSFDGVAVLLTQRGITQVYYP